jgi:signal recognition particle subunit SEC65
MGFLQNIFGNKEKSLENMSIEELREIQDECEDTIISCNEMLGTHFSNPGKVSDSEWLKQVGNYRNQKKAEKEKATNQLKEIEEELKKRGEET